MDLVQDFSAFRGQRDPEFSLAGLPLVVRSRDRSDPDFWAEHVLKFAKRLGISSVFVSRPW